MKCSRNIRGSGRAVVAALALAWVLVPSFTWSGIGEGTPAEPACADVPAAAASGVSAYGAPLQFRPVMITLIQLKIDGPSLTVFTPFATTTAGMSRSRGDVAPGSGARASGGDKARGCQNPSQPARSTGNAS